MKTVTSVLLEIYEVEKRIEMLNKWIDNYDKNLWYNNDNRDEALVKTKELKSLKNELKSLNTQYHQIFSSPANTPSHAA